MTHTLNSICNRLCIQFQTDNVNIVFEIMINEISVRLWNKGLNSLFVSVWILMFALLVALVELYPKCINIGQYYDRKESLCDSRLLSITIVGVFRICSPFATIANARILNGYALWISELIWQWKWRQCMQTNHLLRVHISSAFFPLPLLLCALFIFYFYFYFLWSCAITILAVYTCFHCTNQFNLQLQL